jgi:hypothetical protein
MFIIQDDEKDENLKNYKIYINTLHYILKIFMEIALKNDEYFIMHDTQNVFDHSHYLFHERGLLNKILLTHMGIKLYNRLPIQIKQLDTYKSFKKEVKIFLVHNAVYTIEEFYAL